MKKILLLLLVLYPMLVADLAKAEGGCPAGMVPYRGADLSSCGPIPAGYSDNADVQKHSSDGPPVYWEDRWGSIAFSDVNNSVGVSADQQSKRAATKAAVAECLSAGGKKCSTEISYHNQCGVIAWGDRYGNAAAAHWRSVRYGNQNVWKKHFKLQDRLLQLHARSTS